MSHEIAFDASRNKFMCFTAGEPAWHHLGQNVKEAQNWEHAMQLSGLDFEVMKDELFDRTGQQVPAWGIFRKDTKHCLGVVGAGYTPIQNKYAFDFVDALIGANGGAHFESAGALYSGQTIWCLARIPKGDGEVVPGDPSEMYLLFTSSHDGSKSALSKIVNVRVVCHNTLTSALRGAGEAIKIRHTKSADARLEYARQFLAGAVEQVQDVRLKLRQLAEREMTKESFKVALDRMFPTPKKGDEQKVSARRENVLTEILQLYEANDGNNGVASIKGSAYNLLNAVTQWTDHVRGVRVTDKRKGMTDASVRADNAMFGTGATLKENALEIILEATAANPRRTYSTTYLPAMPNSTGGLLDSVLDQPVRDK